MRTGRAMNYRLIVIVSLTVLTVASYWRTPFLSFLGYDDNLYVTDNVHVQEGLSVRNTEWALSLTDSANWHPLTWISHTIDYQIYRMNPAGHHASSLIIHVANVVLLFWILQVMTGAIWRSGLVAGLFAVHPLNVESVAWVAERKSVLSTLLLMLTILAYVWYARRTSWRRYLTVLALFSLGLMAKPMLVTLPFILLLLDYWPLRRFTVTRMENAETDHKGADSVLTKDPRCSPGLFARLLIEKTPLLAMALGDCVVTLAAQRRMGAIVPLSTNPLTVRLENAAVSYVKYLEKMVWPASLAVPYPLDQRITIWHLAAAGVILASISALVIWKAKQYRYLVVGWLWYLGTLVPVIGLVQVGPQAMADRYAYVPLIGVFVMIVWGMAELKGATRPAIPSVVCLGVMIALGLRTSYQTGYWRDDVTLFEHTKNVTYNNSTAFDMLGNIYAREGKFDQAIEEFSRIPATDSSYCKAQSSIGTALLEKHQLEEAIIHFKMAIEANPEYADAYNRMGAALAELGRIDEAIQCFQRALEYNPNHPISYANLGAAYDEKGDEDEALRYYAKSLELSIDQISQYGQRARAAAANIDCRMGDLLLKERRVAEAVNRYLEALRLEPELEIATQRLNMVRDNAHIKEGMVP